MTIRTLLGAGLAAAGLAIPATPAGADPVCLGGQDTGGVCAEVTPRAGIAFHVGELCVPTPQAGCAWVPYVVVDDVWVGEPTVAAYCYGSIARTLDCPS